MWEAIEAYFEQNPPRTDHVQPYFAADGKPTFEYTFAIPLTDPGFPLHPSGEPFLYTGRFDMLGTYLGRPCVRDEKTTGGSLGDSWADQWDLRAQFMGYVWACQQAGIDLDTVIVRGISILKTKLTIVEAVKTYPKYKVQRWYEQLRRDLVRLRAMWDDGYFDYNFGESCTAYGGCQFRSVCGAQDPDAWHSNYVVRHWSPLNKNPVEEPVA